MPDRATRPPASRRTMLGRVCRLCGQQATPETPVSKRRKCQPCADRNVYAAVVALHTKSGPLYETYRERYVAGWAAYCARRRARRASHPGKPTAAEPAAAPSPAPSSAR